MPDPLFNHLDHIAIVVKDTEAAIEFYHGTLGLPLVFSEVLDSEGVRLTHLDMGNLHLQLVEPLTADHPLQRHLSEKGEGLHHLCFRAANVSETLGSLPDRGLQAKTLKTHSGPLGRTAGFVDPSMTRGVIWEMTTND